MLLTEIREAKLNLRTSILYSSYSFPHVPYPLSVTRRVSPVTDGKQSRAEEEGRQNPGARGRLSRGEGDAKQGDRGRRRASKDARKRVRYTHDESSRDRTTGETSRHREEERKDSRSLYAERKKALCSDRRNILKVNKRKREREE